VSWISLRTSPNVAIRPPQRGQLSLYFADELGA
jgi:hypothetical protein